MGKRVQAVDGKATDAAQEETTEAAPAPAEAEDEATQLARHIMQVVGAPAISVGERGCIHYSTSPQDGVFRLEVDEGWRSAFALRAVLLEAGLVTQEALERADAAAKVFALRMAAVTLEAKATAARVQARLALPAGGGAGLRGVDGRQLTGGGKGGNARRVDPRKLHD